VKTGFYLSFSIHFLACFWIRLAYLEEPTHQPGQGQWIINFGLEDASEFEIYVNAFEFIVATFTTVGYGNTYATT
jgi:hypothetical protein